MQPRALIDELAGGVEHCDVKLPVPDHSLPSARVTLT
jgi:hypothetical protein